MENMFTSLFVSLNAERYIKKNKAVYGHVLMLRFATLVRKHVFLEHFGHLKGTTGTTQVLMSVLMFFQALYDTCMECFATCAIFCHLHA